MLSSDFSPVHTTRNAYAPMVGEIEIESIRKNGIYTVTDDKIWFYFIYVHLYVYLQWKYLLCTKKNTELLVNDVKI